jgi:hypothetical protein
MGSSSSKFKKYLQHGDEFAAMQVGEEKEKGVVDTEKEGTAGVPGVWGAEETARSHQQLWRGAAHSAVKCGAAQVQCSAVQHKCSAVWCSTRAPSVPSVYPVPGVSIARPTNHPYNMCTLYG